MFSRTIKCIRSKKLDYVVRVCGDRPFFDTKIMNKMINIIIKNKYDIVTNVFPRTVPKGLTCEVANSKIFLETRLSMLNTNEKEHILIISTKRQVIKFLILHKT